jgi:hypothetical protein
MRNLVATYHHWSAHVRLPPVHHAQWWAVLLLVVGLVAVCASAAVLLRADVRSTRHI